MGAVLAANIAGFKGRLTKATAKACGFGAVITRILRHLEFDLDNHEPAKDKVGDIDWNDLDIASLVSKEFLAGPYSRIRGVGPYVYVFQDRERRRLYCELPRVDQTALLSADAVEFLPLPAALVPKPSFFRPKYQERGSSSSHQPPQQAEGSSAAHEEAAPEDEPQPYHLLPTDSSEYMLSELPPNATKRQHQQWTQESIKKNNTMLHKIWTAISRIRPCSCRTDDTIPRQPTPTSSGDSGPRRPSKRSRQDDAGPSGTADDE